MFVIALAGCSRPVPEPVALTGVAFYSMAWEVKVSSLPSSLSPRVLQQRLQRRLDTVNGILSTYQPDTELMRFNRTPQLQPFPASELLLSAVNTAMQVSEQTNGVYDPTIGPLVNLWGFGPEAVPIHVPDVARIEAARQRVGWRQVAVDRASGTLVRRKDVQLDLSSLGEGVGVDEMVAELGAQGLTGYMVSVAGTIRIAGMRPDGKPWRIAVESPDGQGRPEVMLRLQGKTAISTSGAYRNYHEIDGVRYSHTLDPRTGHPISHRGVSVTVVMPDSPASRADAWATALNVLGPEEGLTLADRLGIAALFLVKTDTGFASRPSRAFHPYLPEK